MLAIASYGAVTNEKKKTLFVTWKNEMPKRIVVHSIFVDAVSLCVLIILALHFFH